MYVRPYVCSVAPTHQELPACQLPAYLPATPMKGRYKKKKDARLLGSGEEASRSALNLSFVQLGRLGQTTIPSHFWGTAGDQERLFDWLID